MNKPVLNSKGDSYSCPFPVRPTSLLYLSALIAALGGLLFGLDTAVISGTTASLTKYFALTPLSLGFTVSSGLLGTILGTVISGYGADSFGRRYCLRLAAIAYVLSAIGCAVSTNWPLLISFRVVGGLGIGASSVLAPMYIAEIAPANRRGRLVAIFQLNIVLGILLAYASNYVIGLLALGAWEWRWELGSTAIPAAVFLSLLVLIPESPRWLVKQTRNDEARVVLERIGEADPTSQIDRIANTWADEKCRAGTVLFSARNRKPIFLAIAMGVFCQLSGINAVLYFLNDVFAGAGLTAVSGSLRGIIIGFTNLVFTILAMACIDRFGRRFLLISGSVLMAITLTLIGHFLQAGTGPMWLLVLLMAYCAAFSFSEGTVMWVYISELFPLDVREKGQGLGSTAHWIANAVISTIFPVALSVSKSLPFYFFASMMALQFLVVLLFFPETKGRSLESGVGAEPETSSSVMESCFLKVPGAESPRAMPLICPRDP